MLNDETLVIERVLDRVAEEETISHGHLRGQFILVKHGVLHGHTQGQQWLIRPGMAVWMPPNTLHWGQAYNRVDLTVLYISPELCCAFTPHVKVIDASLLIVALCARLSDAKQPLPPARRNRMLQMLFEEIEEIPVSHLTLPQPQDKRLKKITDSLIDNPAQRRSLNEWGKLVGATQRTLARLFYKETGLRYTEWYNRLLLVEAWQGLAGGASNDQLSGMLGFSSGDSFGHWFRRVAGSYPGKVRKSLQAYHLDTCGTQAAFHCGPPFAELQ